MQGSATAMRRYDHDTLDSTQLEVRRLLEAQPERGPFMVVARRQTAGRGRLGRHWSGDPDRTLMFSLWCPTGNAPVDLIGLLPLAAGIAVIRWLDHLVPDLRVKWPNDIVTPAGGKLAGILCEGLWKEQRFAGSIVGVGINVRRPPDTTALEAAGARVAALADFGPPPRDELNADLPRLANEICRLANDLLQGGSAELIAEVNQRLLRSARMVTLRRFESENTVGYIEGVSERGHLLFRRSDNGIIEEIASGELQLPDQGIEGNPQQGTSRASDG